MKLKKYKNEAQTPEEKQKEIIAKLKLLATQDNPQKGAFDALWKEYEKTQELSEKQTKDIEEYFPQAFNTDRLKQILSSTEIPQDVKATIAQVGGPYAELAAEVWNQGKAVIAALRGKKAPKKDAANKQDFSEEERKELAAQGEAMPDGSFPIRNLQDLKDAIKSYGLVGDKEAAKKWIIKRARDLDKVSELPEKWKVSDAAKPQGKAVNLNDYIQFVPSESGKELLTKRVKEDNEMLGNSEDETWKFYEENEDGVVKMQLYDFINIFGPAYHTAAQKVPTVDNEIYI